MYAPRIRREIGGTGPSHGPSIPAHPGPSVDDAALKKLFSHPRMIELLIRRHVPQWDGKIDYSTLERGCPRSSSTNVCGGAIPT